MANIKDKIDKIRSAIFGKEVRGSLADGLDAVNKETERTTAKQEHLEKTFDSLIINSGNSNAEIVDARTDKNTNKTYPKMGDRMDEISSQLSEKASRTDLNTSFYDFDCIEYRDTIANTTYWITKIPYVYKGERVKLNVGLSNYHENGIESEISTNENGERASIYDHEYNETVRSFANRKNSSICINAGIWNVTTGNFVEIGNTIIDGVIKHSDIKNKNRWSCCFDENGIINCYDGTVSAEELLNKGIKNSVTGFVPIILDSIVVNDNIKNDYLEGWNTRAPRQIICQDYEKNYIILTSTGRLPFEDGFTLDDVVRILTPYNIRIAFNLDGGGSTTLVKESMVINKVSDDRGKSERPCYSFIYANKEIKNEKDKDISNLYKRIGELEEKIRQLIFSPTNRNGYIQLYPNNGFHTQGIEVWDDSIKMAKLQTYAKSLGYWDYENSRAIFNINSEGDLTTTRGVFGDFLTFSKPIDNLNTLKRGGIYWSTKDTIGRPSDTSHGIIQFQIGSKNILQVAIPFMGTGIKKRRIIDDVPTNWENA